MKLRRISSFSGLAETSKAANSIDGHYCFPTYVLDWGIRQRGMWAYTQTVITNLQLLGGDGVSGPAGNDRYFTASIVL